MLPMPTLLLLLVLSVLLALCWVRYDPSTAANPMAMRLLHNAHG